MVPFRRQQTIHVPPRPSKKNFCLLVTHLLEAVWDGSQVGRDAERFPQFPFVRHNL